MRSGKYAGVWLYFDPVYQNCFRVSELVVTLKMNYDTVLCVQGNIAIKQQFMGKKDVYNNVQKS